jgi:hypothetical protein
MQVIASVDHDDCKKRNVANRIFETSKGHLLLKAQVGHALADWYLNSR